MDIIKLDIKPNEVLNILSNYYSNKLGKNIKIEVDLDRCVPDYYMDCYIHKATFYYKDDITILNQTVSKTNYLSEDEVKEVLKEIVVIEDYEVNKININVDTMTVGYYRDEHDETVFNGIDIELKNKEKKLIRK